MGQKSNTAAYQAALTVVLFLLIIFMISGQRYFMIAALIVGLLALLSKTLNGWIDLTWGKVIAALGFINAHILLSIIFFALLTPLAFFYRLFTGDRLKLKGGSDSYFEERNHTYESKDLQNPW